MKTLKKHIGLLAFIAILSGCNKNMVDPDSPAQDTKAKQLNAATLSVSAMSPTSGIAYTAVTITGTKFSKAIANDVVKFNGITALINSATTTQIVATVPAGATTGTVTVTVNGTIVPAGSFKVLNIVKSGSLASPAIPVASLAFDKSGIIYAILSPANKSSTLFKYVNGKYNTIYKTPNDTTINNTNGNHSSYTYTLTSLVTDSKGNIYTSLVQYVYTYSTVPISNIWTSSILKITPAGNVSVFATNVNSQPFGELAINAATIDANDNIYIIDNGSNATGPGKVDKITPAGITSTLFTGQSLLAGIAVDKTGNVYTGDYSNGAIIEKISPQTGAWLIAGPYAGVFPTFTFLDIDASGNLIANGGTTNIILNQAGYVNNLSFSFLNGMKSFVDNAGNIYTVNNTAITKYVYQ